MKPKEFEASELEKPSPLERRVEMKVRRQPFVILALTLGVSLLLGAPSLKAAAESTVPTIKKETVVFKACSREKIEKQKRKVEEHLRKSKEWHEKKREEDLRKKAR
jgi:hypothetical protein